YAPRSFPSGAWRCPCAGWRSSWRFPDTSCSLLRLSRRFRLLHDVVEVKSKSVELILPVFAVAVDPDGGAMDWPGIESTAADATRALLGDETGAHQDLDMLRHRLERNVEGCGQFRNKKRFAVESFEDGAADRIGECGKNQVEPGTVIVRIRLIAHEF